MGDARANRAVKTLAQAVLEVGPLIEPLESPFPVSGPPTAGPILHRVVSRLGAPPLALVGESIERLDIVGRVVSERLNLTEHAAAWSGVQTDAGPVLDQLVDAVPREDFTSFCRTATVRGDGGVKLPAYAAGDPAAPAVVIASACGMPARLAERWVRRLAADFQVLTWESRGLFVDVDGFEGSTDVAAQAADLVAVMDHFGVDSAHVAGLCGGAVIAVAAARREPRRITSLSLWHGDFDLGPHTPKTDHQRNLQALMSMAAQARVSPTTLHAALTRSMLAAAPPDLAHLVLYPYVTPERLFRYCQLNGAIMGTDISADIVEVRQPALVVTSRDDMTAHPAGSRLVAEALTDARLEVSPHGDHISVFRRPPELLSRTVHDLLSMSGGLR